MNTAKGAGAKAHSDSQSADMRLVCIQLMQQLQTQGGSLTRLLPIAQERVAESEQAQLQAWSYGFARWSGELRGLVDQMLDKPLKPKDIDVYLLMQLGIFQLRHTPMASHAAVNETVKVIKRLKKPWAKGLVNAVLRNYQRSQIELESALSQAARWSHPEWLLNEFQRDWSEQWQAICDANNIQGPMTLRINRRHGDVHEYQQKLIANGIQASTIEGVEDALTLESPVSVGKLPGFDQGYVSVQDAAAQLAGLQLIKYVHCDGRLLDACAAPGGKTAHALEQNHYSSVTAIDHDADRLERVAQTLARLKLQDQAQLIASDATDLDAWWDGRMFDAILLDAPCSGTGVIRRHPDIKLLRRNSDIAALVSLQASLLDSLWKTLAVKGVLLYATCSILKDENERQVDSFLARTPAAELAGDMRQILPGEQGMDGFFYAPIRKII